MPTKEELLAGGGEAKSSFVTFSKIGDFIKGVFVESRQTENQLASVPGTMQNVYDFVAIAGEYHKTETNPETDVKVVVEPAIQIQPGDYHSVGGKAAIDVAMRKVKPGQHVYIELVGSKPNKTKGLHPTKQWKVVLFDDYDPAYSTEGQARAILGADSAEGSTSAEVSTPVEGVVY